MTIDEKCIITFFLCHTKSINRARTHQSLQILIFKVIFQYSADFFFLKIECPFWNSNIENTLMGKQQALVFEKHWKRPCTLLYNIYHYQLQETQSQPQWHCPEAASIQQQQYQPQRPVPPCTEAEQRQKEGRPVSAFDSLYFFFFLLSSEGQKQPRKPYQIQTQLASSCSKNPLHHGYLLCQMLRARMI